MYSICRGAALAVCASLAIGCGAQSPTSDQSQAIAAENLPNVGGCETLQRHGRVTLQPVAGVHDLFLARVDGQAVCVDSLQGIQLSIGQKYAMSNPMPGTDPAGDSSSNPMPGVDPASSNPMPGTDPSSSGSSNPMPGNNR